MDRWKPILPPLVVVLLHAGCGGDEPEAPATPKDEAPVGVRVEGFATPESVLHDEAADVYLVSNVNGAPTAKDDNGFISRITPEGKILDRKWIDGALQGVTLHAPKGMAIVADVLYVADIDTVRKFDRRSGAPLGEIAIPGSTFVNDLSAAPDGDVYVTDSGFKADFTGSGTDAIYVIDAADGVRTLIKDAELGNPNGIVAVRAGSSTQAYVVGWTTGELYEVDRRGRRTVTHKTPKAQLDGLVRLGEGDWIASSWEAAGLYRMGLQGGVEMHAENLPQPADIGFDRRRGNLLIPLFGDDVVVIRKL